MSANFSSKITAALSHIQKNISSEILVDLEDKDKYEYNCLCKSGSIGLDIALGNGWVKSRFIELSGPESSGKTTLAILAIIAVQKRGGTAAFIDAEHAFSLKYFRELGGDTNKLILVQPDTAEQALESLRILIGTGEIEVGVLDSTNALAPETEMEGEAGDLKVGLAARLLSQHCRQMTPLMKLPIEPTIFYISQMREKIGVMYGDPRVIGVGNAMKFYASQRVMFKIIEKIEGGENKEYIGNKVRATVIKNKVAPPFREAEFVVIYGVGISREYEIIEAALKLKVLIKTGQGILTGFETPLWSGPIGTSEPKALEAFKTDDFADLKYEVEQRLKVELKELTEEECNNSLIELHKKYNDKNVAFEEMMKYANLYSGKSLHIESLYFSNEASRIKPLDKIAAKKVKDMEAKIYQRFLKKEEFKPEIVIEYGGEENIDLKQTVVLTISNEGRITDVKHS
jgi:recombination protein RecA